MVASTAQQILALGQNSKYSCSKRTRMLAARDLALG
jgi:hypothetical protein